MYDKKKAWRQQGSGRKVIEWAGGIGGIESALAGGPEEQGSR